MEKTVDTDATYSCVSACKSHNQQTKKQKQKQQKNRLQCYNALAPQYSDVEADPLPWLAGMQNSKYE